MNFDRTCLQDELKVCGWCNHWTQCGDTSFGQCKIQPTLVDIKASGIVVKVTDDGYCDEFEPSEDCIEESRILWKEKNEFDEEKYNGVKAGRDFPRTLNK